MNLEDVTTKILSKYVLCNYCFGRQFSHLSTRTTNYERGKTIKAFLTMKFSSFLSEESITFLQRLSKTGEESAKQFLLKKNIIPEETQSCYICEDYLNRIDELVNIIIERANDIEFQTFLIGSSIPKNIIEREKEIKDEYSLSQTEYLKQEFNRNIGKRLIEELAIETDFKEPEIVVETYPFSFKCDLKIRSIYLYGRYLKHVRNIPQTRWPCRKCKGKGCSECNNTGKQYNESVEEIIENKAIELTKGDKGVLHGAGREDIDARMLGSGRPFVLEIISPRIRNINLKNLQETTNGFGKGKVEVKDFRYSTKKELIHLKNSAEQSIKKYRALISFDTPITDKIIKKIDTSFDDTIIDQRTPLRVSHRRADKIRKKKVHSIQSKRVSNSEIESLIVCDGGCYVKELISGDEERSSPSISEVAGVKAICTELDVLEIEEKPYSEMK
ncbi:MAG: tRNA pseudouridine(54/55) synthase Pus10 [Candidatus Heimdallarchaeaceae archaeon]|jgi:tRNA pseudouridine synthase 10